MKNQIIIPVITEERRIILISNAGRSLIYGATNATNLVILQKQSHIEAQVADQQEEEEVYITNITL